MSRKCHAAGKVRTLAGPGAEAATAPRALVLNGKNFVSAGVGFTPCPGRF